MDDFEATFTGACTSGGALSRLLIRVVQAWTKDRLGGVIVACPSRKSFISIEFFDIANVNGKAAIEVELVVAPTEDSAARFLAGETFVTVTADSVDDFKRASAHILQRSSSRQGLIDIKSGCKLLTGKILPA
jgi:hypothetical protein